MITSQPSVGVITWRITSAACFESLIAQTYKKLGQGTYGQLQHGWIDRHLGLLQIRSCRLRTRDKG